MPELIQLNIFNEREVVNTTNSKLYKNFVKKFELKKTTDDCYTPPAVYDAVLKYVNEYILKISNLRILRPFKPGGDYLSEKYDKNTVVIDNPPFSIYRKILRNYLNMNVKFFLFAPSLTMFVPDENRLTYYISNNEIIYENGARVRTGFVTNIRTDGCRVILSGVLHDAIKQAQKTNKKFNAFDLPEIYINSAKLQKYVMPGQEIALKTENQFITDFQKRRIFGSAIKLTDTDINILKAIK